MNFAKGKCIVTKQECDDCLVLPKGTFSAARDVVISQEGANGLKTLLSDKDAKFKENATCCINLQVYEKCLVMPMGILHPKAPMTISADAVDGILAAIKEGPKEEPVDDTPPPSGPADEEVTSEKIEALKTAKLELEIVEENIAEINEALTDAADSEAAKLNNQLVAANSKRDTILATIAELEGK